MEIGKAVDTPRAESEAASTVGASTSPVGSSTVSAGSTPSTRRTMERVFLCTPFCGSPPSIFPNASKPNPQQNIDYAKKCMAECLGRGQAALPPHLLYPQVLDDENPKDRQLGMTAGRTWLYACEAVECYVDQGVSSGMRQDLEAALRLLIPIRFRSLAGPPPAESWLHQERVPHPSCALCERFIADSALAEVAPTANSALAEMPLDLSEEDPDETLDPNRPAGPIADPEERKNNEPAV